MKEMKRCNFKFKMIQFIVRSDDKCLNIFTRTRLWTFEFVLKTNVLCVLYVKVLKKRKFKRFCGMFF